MFYKLSFVLLILVVAIFAINKIIAINEYNNEVIKVQITLINKCELYDDAFMVRSIPSNKVAVFTDKKTEMFLKRSSKIKLEVNKKYPGFHFTSIPVKVNYNTNLIADCSNSDRLDSIFDSLNNQFNKNSN